jgi:carbon monoxide dehydrogenase subunit G
MEMKGSRTVPADVEATWRALNDPEVLKACIVGCESIERVSDNEYKVTMTARVGPVSARFSGRIVMSDIVAPTSYVLSFEGQGGAAGFAKGQARVALAANDPGTRIDYQATAQVGGKLAQIGSRLVDGAAAKVADDFFARFVERLGGDSTNAVVAEAPGASATNAPATTEGQLRAALRTMSVRLVLAAVIIAAMAIYWLTRPA